jgi:hypothetical protein
MYVYDVIEKIRETKEVAVKIVVDYTSDIELAIFPLAPSVSGFPTEEVNIWRYLGQRLAYVLHILPPFNLRVVLSPYISALTAHLSFPVPSKSPAKEPLHHSPRN